MKILISISDDNEHRHALETTGFWGKRGAGALFLATDTKRFLFAHRSQHVEQPNTWGTWGGAIDSDESPKAACLREIREEAGYELRVELKPIYVFRHPSGFEYHNFLAIVEEEFEPKLNWETQGFSWVDYGDWPRPLHSGAKSLLNASKSYLLKAGTLC